MIVAALLVFVVILYRVVLGVAGTEEGQWFHNFSPMAAIALCGAIYFPRRIAIAVPLLALLVSDLILNAHYGIGLINWAMLPQYFALGLIVGFGWMLRTNATPARTLATSIAGSAFFFLITNTAAWIADPIYPKTAAGWAQAMTVGDRIHTPTTLEFFRNTLASDVIFTAAFLLCVSRRMGARATSLASRREELTPW